jgi:hypothetical protein
VIDMGHISTVVPVIVARDSDGPSDWLQGPMSDTSSESRTERTFPRLCGKGVSLILRFRRLAPDAAETNATSFST